VYQVTVNREHNIVEFVLDGLIRVDEMKEFVEALRKATTSLAGHDIKIKADLRSFKAASQEVAEMIRAVQEFGLKSGVKRVAEIVESEMVALQLNRVAKESGISKILRRFWEDDSASDWLIHGDPA
jgi:hypothetical protein